MTPLHWACTEHSQKHVQLLLQYGANVESIDQSGCTPLLIAAQYGHVDLVAMLLRRGHANGLAVDKSLDTALHWAAYKGSMAVCGVLTFLVPQLSYRTPDAFGQTPLHLAALRGHTSVVRYILANLHYTAGAGTSSSGGGGGSGDHHHPIDIMDDDDEEDDQERMLLLSTSFLSTSPRRRQRQRLLLKTKEDLLYLRDSQGRTPLELAMFKQRPSVAALLQHEMDQLKLQQAYASASTPYIKKVTLYAQHTLKTMCSLHNWKVWMGCRPTSAAAIHDEVDESPKFPFYLVISIIIAHVLFYLTVLTPILAVEQGLLWDFMGWHLLNWLWMVACWYCFYKIATTSPGYVGGVGGSSRSSSSSSSSGGGKGGGVLRRGGSHRSSRSSSLTTSTRTHVDSKPLRQRSYSQAALTKKWRRRYEQVLDSYAVDDEDAMTANGTAGATAKLKALRERVRVFL
jgi:ankyrin repeat protein